MNLRFPSAYTTQSLLYCTSHNMMQLIVVTENFTPTDSHPKNEKEPCASSYMHAFAHVDTEKCSCARAQTQVDQTLN